MEYDKNLIKVQAVSKIMHKNYINAVILKNVGNLRILLWRYKKCIKIADSFRVRYESLKHKKVPII